MPCLCTRTLEYEVDVVWLGAWTVATFLRSACKHLHLSVGWLGIRILVSR